MLYYTICLRILYIITINPIIIQTHNTSPYRIITPQTHSHVTLYPGIHISLTLACPFTSFHITRSKRQQSSDALPTAKNHAPAPKPWLRFYESENSDGEWRKRSYGAQRLSNGHGFLESIRSHGFPLPLQ